MTNVDLNSVRAHVETLIWTKTRQSELTNLEKKAREAIEEVLGDNEIGQLDGQTVITWTTHKKRQFQQKKLAEEHPNIVDEFTELVEARTFKVVK